MEAIVVGGIAILIFAAWDTYENRKLLRKNDESPAVGRCEALKTTTSAFQSTSKDANTITERVSAS